MIISGSIQTLAIKWADMIESDGFNKPIHKFNHPLIQTLVMFCGEIMCILLDKIYRYCLPEDKCLANKIKYDKNSLSNLRISNNFKKNNDINVFKFALPAFCDMISASIMYYALNLTFASSFQMFRGGVIIFTGILSTLILDTRLARLQWIGIIVVMLGLVFVGVSDICCADRYNDVNKINNATYLSLFKTAIADILIFLSQIIVAFQVVYEERLVTKYPTLSEMTIIGWEGIFGVFMLVPLIILASCIPIRKTFFVKNDDNIVFDNQVYFLENPLDAFYQISGSYPLKWAIFCNFICVPIFSISGLHVTKGISATTRMVVDTLRIILVWVFSLVLKWQSFHKFQFFGCIIIICGISLYQNFNICVYFCDLRNSRLNKNKGELNKLENG
ncbi:unnamed protein product [Gordionus sp. m RMFG-2023]